MRGGRWVFYDVMTDMVMLAFYLTGMCSFIYGIDNDDKKILLLSGAFTGLAILTRYAGFTLIPLFFAYSVLNKRSLLKTFFPVLVSALLLGVWAFQNFIYYGEFHFIESSRFFAKFYEHYCSGFNGLVNKAISNLSGIGGCAIFPFAWLAIALTGRSKIIIYFVSVLFSLYVLIINPLNLDALRSYSHLQLGLLIFFLTTGLFITCIVFTVGIKAFITFLLKTTTVEKRDATHKHKDNLFLSLWFCGILISAIIILPFGTARYMLPLLLPMMMLFINQTEKVLNKVNYFKIFCTSVIAITLLAGFCMAYVDYVYAESYRSFAKYLKKNLEYNRVWYIGEWGFRYYMGKEGYSYLRSNNISPEEGDIIVKPRIAGLHEMAKELRLRVDPIESLEYENKFPIRLMGHEAKAGFYAHGFGFLPFSFSTAQLEHFDIFKVRDPNFFIINLNKAVVDTSRMERVKPLIFNINGDSRVTLFEHPPSKITYKVTVPENSCLTFSIALSPAVWSEDKGDGVIFEIFVKVGTEERKLFSKYIDPKNKIEDRKWHDELIDLSEYKGAEVLLKFVTSPGPYSNGNYDWAGWGNPRLVPFTK